MWYPTLRKSKLVIPIWAFIPVALLYYLMCGRLIHRLLIIEAPRRQRTTALVLLGSMMLANEGWNYLFGSTVQRVQIHMRNSRDPLEADPHPHYLDS